MRLDKFVCKSTLLDRAQARAAITSGRLAVNGVVALDPAMQVHENNAICLDDQPLVARPSRYLMLHKPANSICSNVDELYPSLFSVVDLEDAADLHISGRLDADTTGLVLATDDGRWSFNITSPQQRCEKEYRVRLQRPIEADAVALFAQGLQLHGEAKLARPARLEILSPTEVLLTLTEGKFHQVKRMFKAIGNRVVSLHRQRIGSLDLDIEQGQWRHLTPEEVMSLGQNA